MDAAMHTGGASTVANPLSDIVQRRLDTGIDPPRQVGPARASRHESGFVIRPAKADANPTQ
jgi:hypothetical protein